MNVSFEKKSPVDGVLTVNVVEADYADKIKNELKKLQKQVTVPGFRAGKVPAGEIKRRFGKHVKSDVLNDTVYEAVVKYITDEKLPILGEPLPMAVEEVDLEKPDFTFEYKIGLAPEINVKLDKEVKLPYYNIEITDEMYNEQDQNLRERFGAQVPGEEADKKAVIKGALMQLNEDGTVNENEGAIQVPAGIVAPFLFKDQDEAAKFLGKKVGDKVVFNPYKSADGNAAELASMLNLDKEIAGDVKSDFEMAISEIIVVKPAEHNEEFFENVFGKDKVKTEEEYKEALTADMKRALDSNSRQLFARDADKYLMDTYGKDLVIPEEFLKEWLVKRNDELTDENIAEEFEKMRDSLKWQLISDRAKQALDVKVTEDDRLNFAKSLAYNQFMQYGMTNVDDETVTDFAKRILADKNQGQRIAEEVENVKFYETLRNAVTLEDKTVSLEDFRKLAQA